MCLKVKVVRGVVKVVLVWIDVKEEDVVFFFVVESDDDYYEEFLVIEVFFKGVWC